MDQLPETPAQAQILAAHCLAGPTGAFEAELTQMAEDFTTLSTPPDHAVEVTTADGRQSIRWSPGRSQQQSRAA